MFLLLLRLLTHLLSDKNSNSSPLLPYTNAIPSHESYVIAPGRRRDAIVPIAHDQLAVHEHLERTVEGEAQRHEGPLVERARDFSCGIWSPLEGSRALDVGDEGYDADESDVEDSPPVSAWKREDYGGDVKGGKGRGAIEEKRLYVWRELARRVEQSGMRGN